MKREIAANRPLIYVVAAFVAVLLFVLLLTGCASGPFVEPEPFACQLQVATAQGSRCLYRGHTGD
jgi:hypothetical protein